jgi:hypothetical protein
VSNQRLGKPSKTHPPAPPTEPDKPTTLEEAFVLLETCPGWRGVPSGPAQEWSRKVYQFLKDNGRHG